MAWLAAITKAQCIFLKRRPRSVQRPGGWVWDQSLLASTESLLRLDQAKLASTAGVVSPFSVAPSVVFDSAVDRHNSVSGSPASKLGSSAWLLFSNEGSRFAEQLQTESRNIVRTKSSVNDCEQDGA